ncbi:hypothetical protein ATO6_18275 [Oceanicola sp. 22II-s10i]|uniref:hypothetical protein n=1 Tax=Oceanicola sp. 22II-s10i TaxID=1317116 RepID=UPI000B523316|nr:hypothetical protein [Oceanicola sp. 22II-s10i]OWU83403.1 hypothetical protein ATO6_18275 [Oceanicola sp. 22II-s10i]
MQPPELDAAILAAHAAGDRAALVGLYQQAADGALPDEGPFFLTQAYILALDCGDMRATGLRDRLVALGRERV